MVLCPDIAEETLGQQVSQLRGLSDNTEDVSFAIGTEYCTGSYDINRAIQAADDRMNQDKQEYYRSHPGKDQRKRASSEN